MGARECRAGGAGRLTRASAASLLLVLAVLLAACAGPAPACPGPSTGGKVVYLVDRGWHVEIGMPADQIGGGLVVFRTIFPNARALMFGYGKRTFFTAKTDSLSEYLLGPVPGPAAIQVTALAVLPDAAYQPADTLRLALPPGGANRLSEFLWNDLRRDGRGQPLLIGPGPFPGSLFYAARSGYSLGHTCNAWVVDGLRASGSDVRGGGVVLSIQADHRAIEAGACRPAPAGS